MDEVSLNESLISAVVERNVQQKSLVDKVKQLLQDGADPNSKFVEEMTSLHYAAHKGYEILAMLLLENKADVNLKTENGFTPLHLAVKEKKNVSCVSLLLKHGATVNSKTAKNTTPLHLAVAFGNVAIVKLLLSYEADVNSKSEYCDSICDNGSTPLHVAAKNPKSSTCANVLLICGADIESTDEDGFTPLHVAVKHSSVKNVKLLMDYNADVNTKEISGWTPLHTAASSRKRISLIQLLIEYGSEIEAKDNKGRTPLHIAVEFNSVKNTKLLLEGKAEINSINEDGLTPLHIAAENCNSDILKLLLKHGAEPNARSMKGMTPLHNAISSLTPVHNACSAVYEKGWCKFLKLLLESKADINSQSNNGDTPLHMSIRKGTQVYAQVTKLLLEHNADINILNKEGKTPFECIPSQMEKPVAFFIFENTLYENILKRQTANMYVNAAILKLCDERVQFYTPSKMRRFKTDCEKEISLMKNVVVANGVTLYEILTFNLVQIARYTRNEEAVQFMKSYNFKNTFHLYGTILRSQFIRGAERNALLDQFCLCTNNILPMPMECLENIICYLSNADFRNLIEVLKLM